jgi:Kef-type K+ transport system membrane component KefB
VSLTLLLLQIAVILALCRLLHGILRRMGQPPVIGEIIAGLLLGPSFLGWLAPSWYAQLFPATSLPALNGLSQIGLVLFMFLVGLRLDLGEVRAFRHIAGLAGILSIVVPFTAGLALAGPLHAFAPQSPMLPFSLFLAVSMSITAFPVLARILRDERLTETPLGHIAITCAAMNDVAAWTLLAWIVALTRSTDGHASILGTIATVVAYGLIMAFAVRPALRLLTRRFPVMGELQVMLVIAFLSSWATESIGIHAFFGAFFAGVIWPRGENESHVIRDDVSHKLEAVTMTVLIPLFFGYTGIRTNLGLIGGAGAWPYAAAIIAAATVAKIGGAFLGGTLMRFGVRDSLALGALLNTRGLVELIALNVGLDLGILSPALFSMMVLMALTTTLMTVPLLRRILPRRSLQGDRNLPEIRYL